MVMTGVNLPAGHWWVRLNSLWGGCMDVILHTGAHRTAMSAFRNYLDRNEKALKATGISVWGQDNPRSGLLSTILRRRDSVTSDQDRRANRAAGLMSVALAQEARDGTRIVILSDQDMLGDQIQNYTRTRLYPEAALRMSRLRMVLPNAVRKVVLSVRSYEHYWASLIARAMPLGAEAPDRTRLDQLVTQPRRWTDIVREIRAVFPESEVLIAPYERVGHQPERLLSEMIGEPNVPATRFMRERVKPSPDLTEINTALEDRGDVPLPSWPPFPELHRSALHAAYAGDLNSFERSNDPLITLIGGAGSNACTSMKRGLKNDGEEFPLAGIGGRGASQPQAR